jgi:cytoskeleton protein RodZ
MSSHKKRRRRHHDAVTPQQELPSMAEATASASADAPMHAIADDIADTPAAFEYVAPLPQEEVEDATVIGHRLREARESLGLDLTDAGRKLRLPLRVLEKLERGDWSGIDSPLYLRGYLKSYSTLLGIDAPELSPAVRNAPLAAPALVATGGISHRRYLLQRYATAATYLVITAIFVVPMVILGLNGSLKDNLTRLAPLDVPAAPAPATTNADGTQARVAAVPVHPGDDNSTLMASMTPVALLDRELDKSDTSPANPAPAPTGHDLDIRLDAPSWVEITRNGDGKRLEYALLSPGDHHYRDDGVLDVRLGNADAASVSVDGQAQDLGRFRHANVAHFRVDAQGVPQPPPEA